MKQVALSVCLVVNNEEKHLERCLENVRNVADEIIVVDTGSTDRTVEIARKYTGKIFKIRWREDFSKARNFALKKASGDWVLFLDGDEELDPRSIPALKEKTARNDFEGYLIKVLNFYESINGIEIASDIIFRLFRNRKGYRYSGVIHEQICDNITALNPDAKIGIAEDICIMHYGYLKEEIAAKNKAERNTRLLLKSLAKNPNNPLDRFHLGVEYFRAGQFDKALEEFFFVIDKTDFQAVYAPKLMRYITKCHYLMGNLEEALRFINTVWEKSFHDHGDLYYLKGNICRDLGCHAEAYTAFKKCLSVPRQPAHYANLYSHYKDKIFHHLGELAEYFADNETALAHYINALRENPSSIDSLARIIAILEPRDTPEYTMKALNTLFDLTNPGMQLDLGYIFFRERAYQLAVQCFDSAGKQAPLPLEARLVKGLCLMRAKQYRLAVRELNAISPESDFYSTAQSNLFFYYWLQKNNRKAAACLKNIKNSGATPVLVEALEILLKGRRPSPGALKNSRDAEYPVINEIFERLIEFKEFDSLNDALNCFEDLFETRPTKLLANLYFNYGIYDKAETEYMKLVEQNQAGPEIFYRLGKTYWALNNLARAGQYLCKAVEQGYNSPKLNLEMARLYQDLAVKTLANTPRFP